MTGSAYKPAGFCPSCDHAIDPGICPECGRNVSEKELVISQRRQRRRRTALRISKFILVVGLVFGLGYGVYHETRPHRWVKYCTNNYLLDLASDESPGRYIIPELRIRILNGELDSERELDRYLAIEADKPDLWLFPQWPFGLEPQLFGDTQACPSDTRFAGCGGGFSNVFLFYPESVVDSLYIDGRQIAARRNFVSVKDDICPRLASLSVGQHQFEVRRVISFTVPDYLKTFVPSEVTQWSPREIEVASTTSVEVVDATAADLLRPVFNDVNSSIFADWNWSSPFSNEMPYLVNGDSLPPIAGEIQFYGENSDGELELVTCAYPHEACSLRKEIKAMIDRGHIKVGIEFIPDASLAFDRGHESYYSGLLTWRAASLQDIEDGKFGMPDDIVDQSLSD